MVTSRLLTVVLGAALMAWAGAPAVGAAQTPGSALPRPADAGRVAVSCVAIQATREGREERHVDSAIRDIEQAVVDKDTRRYDTYRFLWRGSATVAYEEETALRINARYTLFVTPLSQDRQGRIRVSVRVEEQPDARKRRSGDDKKSEPVVALRTTSLLVPGNHLKLDGLNLDEGKLIVVLTVRPA